MTDTSENRINRRAQIEALPSVKFVCGRDWMRGPYHFEIGFLWGKEPRASQGETVYRRWWLLRWQWNFTLDRS